MGVGGLWTILQSCAYPVRPDSLEGKILAIDVSIWLHQALHGYANPSLTNDKPHIHLLLTRIFKLLHYKIKPIFVFDGGVPQLKKRTMLTRHEKRNNTIQNIENINSQILKNRIWEDIISKYLGNDNSKPKANLKVEEKDLFELPFDTYPNALKERDNVWEKRKITIANALRHLSHNSMDLDIDSDNFNKLPKDIQHEILQELQQANKHPPINNLIHNSDKIEEFSDFQINRLVNQGKISSKIEQVNRNMNLDYVQKISMANKDFTYSDLSNAQIQRMASDETIHYVLVKRKTNYNSNAPQQPPNLNVNADKPLDLDSMNPQDPDSLGDEVSPNPKIYNNEKLSHIFEKGMDGSTPNVYYEAVRPNESETESRATILTDGNHSPEFFNNRDNLSFHGSETAAIHEGGNVASTQDAGHINLESKIALESSKRDEYNVTISPVPHRACETKSLRKRAHQRPNRSTFSKGRLHNSFQFLDLEKRKRAYKLSHQRILGRDVGSKKPTLRSMPKLSQGKMGKKIFQNPLDTRSKKQILWPDKGNSPQLKKSITTSSGCPVKTGSDDIMPCIGDTHKDMDGEEFREDKDSDAGSVFERNQSLKGIKERLLREPKDRYDDVMALNIEKGKLERYSKTMSQTVYEESQELLRIMGIPWVIAPMEAEAQCAYLDSIGLTHGSITDDSDIWLFGGARVYRNFYSTSKDLEFYNLQTIEKNLGLDREKLVMLAIIMGCDYSFGIKGVGPVMALEILSEFGIMTFEDLENFKKWWENCRLDSIQNTEATTALKKRLKDMFIPNSFPEPVVFQAFLSPSIEESREAFTWGSPDFEKLESFVEKKLSWSAEKLESYVIPLKKRLSERKIQYTIDDFCVAKPPSSDPFLPTKRIQNALSKIRNRNQNGNHVQGASDRGISHNSRTKSKTAEARKKSLNKDDEPSAKVDKRVGTKKRGPPPKRQTKFSTLALQNDFALNLSEDSD